VGSFGCGQEPVTGFCENGNEPLCCTKGGEILGLPNDYQRLKQDFVLDVIRRGRTRYAHDYAGLFHFPQQHELMRLVKNFHTRLAAWRAMLPFTKISTALYWSKSDGRLLSMHSAKSPSSLRHFQTPRDCVTSYFANTPTSFMLLLVDWLVIASCWSTEPAIQHT
jgi:hypothetical protein